MNIVVTGSLGHISKPLTETLVQKGHSVTVISSNSNKQKDIEALGAIAAIGTLEDSLFLTETFTGADAVYTMVPPANYFDQTLDLTAHILRVANTYAQALRQSGVKRVVHLSSIGAHLTEGNGIIQVYNVVESIFNKLSDVAITHMRPTSFYYNLFGYLGMVKQGFIAANYGEEKIIWVAPEDIAAAIADEIDTPTTGRKVRYVASDERTGSETAAAIGMAIGMPDLTWMVVADEQIQSGLEADGMQPAIAAGLVEMYASARSGRFWEDYQLHKPTVLGTIKIEDFAREFAAVYNQ